MAEMQNLSSLSLSHQSIKPPSASASASPSPSPSPSPFSSARSSPLLPQHDDNDGTHTNTHKHTQSQSSSWATSPTSGDFPDLDGKVNVESEEEAYISADDEERDALPMSASDGKQKARSLEEAEKKKTELRLGSLGDMKESYGKDGGEGGGEGEGERKVQGEVSSDPPATLKEPSSPHPHPHSHSQLDPLYTPKTALQVLQAQNCAPLPPHGSPAPILYKVLSGSRWSANYPLVAHILDRMLWDAKLHAPQYGHFRAGDDPDPRRNPEVLAILLERREVGRWRGLLPAFDRLMWCYWTEIGPLPLRFWVKSGGERGDVYGNEDVKGGEHLDVNLNVNLDGEGNKIGDSGRVKPLTVKRVSWRGDVVTGIVREKRSDVS
ncbi:hypothetical protein MMC09_005512 [Bachmanniomyces sp. S44760]|nr:hypothetical protein [Bachmanniomyces sp. S44760]